MKMAVELHWGPCMIALILLTVSFSPVQTPPKIGCYLTSSEVTTQLIAGVLPPHSVPQSKKGGLEPSSLLSKKICGRLVLNCPHKPNNSGFRSRKIERNCASSAVFRPASRISPHRRRTYPYSRHSSQRWR